MKQIVAKDIFDEQRDLWKLGAALGIALGKVHEHGKRETFQNVNSLDPDGIFRAIMFGLYPDASPKERAKKLVDHAEWGIREIFRREQNGTLDFSKLCEYGLSPKVTKAEAVRKLGENAKHQTKVHNLSNDIFNLLGDCNNISVSRGKKDIFKLTSKMLKRIADVGTPVKTKDDFGNLVDALYEIVYEGSGRLERIPESFKKEDFIGFVIKFIRADLRHDLEHGKEKEIRRKKKQLAEIYLKFVGKTSLSSLNEKDYAKFHVDFLTELKSFLLDLKQYCEKPDI